MYLVELACGMESYQQETHRFSNREDAFKFYDEKLKERPLKVSIYQQLDSETNM